MTSPPNPNIIPRYTNIASFYRLPIYNDTLELPDDKKTIGIIGIPFDGGCTFRPGARFGPEAVRNASRIVRPYSLFHKIDLFNKYNCIDLGDIITNPFNISKTIDMINKQVSDLYSIADHIYTIGGDHTISYPLLKAVNTKFGKVSLIHFDSHFDTSDSYFEEKLTHGTPFKRVFEDDLIDVGRSIHVGIRGTVTHKDDVDNDKKLGFDTIYCHETEDLGIRGIINKIKNRVGENKVYISLDIDVVDPAFAPGTGTPECGGYSSAQILSIIRGLKGINMIGGDVVEVAPSYDNANITSHLAANICYELMCLQN